MSETGWRLTIGSVLSIIWFAILNHVTDWPSAVVFIVAVLLGFFSSALDLIVIALFEGLAHLVRAIFD